MSDDDHLKRFPLKRKCLMSVQIRCNQILFWRVDYKYRKAIYSLELKYSHAEYYTFIFRIRLLDEFISMIVQGSI